MSSDGDDDDSDEELMREICGEDNEDEDILNALEADGAEEDGLDLEGEEEDDAMEGAESEDAGMEEDGADDEFMRGLRLKYSVVKEVS